jgi:hypothetical protein
MKEVETNLTAQVNLGDHASRILRDPLVKSSLEEMRTTVFHNIRTSKHKDSAEREELYLMLKAIDGFEQEFIKVINGGKKAESRIRDLYKR